MFFAVAAFVVSTTSCKKDWTCECKSSTVDNLTSGTWNAKKKDAQDACDALEKTYSVYGGKCELKKK